MNELVYQECLSREFCSRSISFYKQAELQLSYKGKYLNQVYRPDFICFEKIIVEIKAVSSLCDEHRSQLYNYLKVTGVRLEFLVNFGH